jgi:K+-transporting ATPase KdpF subunit
VSCTRSPAITCRRTPMTFDYILGSFVTVLILVYLVVALIKPERF